MDALLSERTPEWSRLTLYSDPLENNHKGSDGMTLIHGHSASENPAHTLILGAGFVGSATARALQAKGANVTALSSKDIDLLSEGAEEKLASMLTPSTTLVVVSAKAPVKSQKMLNENLQMLTPITGALSQVKPAHIVYVSSDAVYKDSDHPISETSCAEPGSLHGLMHLAREIVLKDAQSRLPCIPLIPAFVVHSAKQAKARLVCRRNLVPLVNGAFTLMLAATV